MKKILITGIDGFVGNYLKEYLEYNCPNSLLYGLSNSDIPENFGKKVEYFKCDILDFDKLQSLIKKIKPDEIFHLAGLAFVPEAETNPSFAIQINALGSFHIFESVYRHAAQAKIVTISSSNVYRKQNGSKPIVEDCPLLPHNIYGLSKYMMESYVQYFCREKKLNIVIMRSFNHFGPRQSDKFVISSFAKQIAEIERTKKEGSLFVGDLSAIRDFTDVRDIVRGYVLAMEKGVSGSAYNICRGEGNSIESLLMQLINYSDFPIEIVPDKNRFRKSEIITLIGSSEKFKRETKWFPEYNINQTLIDVLMYWRKQLGIDVNSLSKSGN